MTTTQYYNHIRSLAPFKAIDAYKLAVEAAALDAAKQAVYSAPVVAREVMPNGEGAMHLSFGIKVF